jgi:hypothetical protein
LKSYLDSNNKGKMNEFLQRRQRREDNNSSESTDNVGAFDVEWTKVIKDFGKDYLSFLK